jgi:hypothetical protein
MVPGSRCLRRMYTSAVYRCWTPSWSNDCTGAGAEEHATITPERSHGWKYAPQRTSESSSVPRKISLILRPCYGGRDYACAVAFASLLGACPITGDSCECAYRVRARPSE